MRNYYVLNNGRVQRKDNTLYIEDKQGEKKPLPIEDVESLYLYGEVDLNSRLLNFLSQKRIPLHVFNYYGFYAGSYYPREYLHSGFLVVQQVSNYSNSAQRAVLAGEFVRGASHSLLRNLLYYENRRGGGSGDEMEAVALPAEVPGAGEMNKSAPTTKGVSHARVRGVDATEESAVDVALTLPGLDDLPDEFMADDSDFEPLAEAGMSDSESGDRRETVMSAEMDGGEPTETLSEIRATMESLSSLIGDAVLRQDIDVLRGIEGKLRERYYAAWQLILRDQSRLSAGSEMITFTRRVRRPPDNPVNALISFGNGHLYTICLSEIYRTQLHPTISYLHEPGARRFSLALDLSEIFKPLIVDRAIFRLLNTGQMKPSHFDRSLGSCYLTDAGKKVFLSALEERLGTTIKHRRLGRNVSYRHLIRLECYKLIRHLTGLEPYRAFRAWW